MAGETVDLAPVEQALRLRFLLYRSGTKPTLAETLSGGLHIGSPPDNAPYPYGAFRILNERDIDLDAPGATVDVELLLFHRPRAESAALRTMADVAKEAGRTAARDLAEVHSSVVRDADVLPAFSEAADPEVIVARLTFTLDLFPAA